MMSPVPNVVARMTILALLSCSADAWVSIPSTTKTRSFSSSSAQQATTYTLDGEEIRGPITPLGNFCFVRTKDTLTATEGGILLPDQSKERPTEGVVVAAGPGKLHPHTGIRITNPVSEGVSVLYGKFDGSPVTYQEEQCQVIRDDDIMLFYEGNMMTLENVTPCRDYVLIKLEEKEEMTASGIMVSSQVTADLEPCEGTVVKVGEGRMASTGELTKSPVEVGQYVKFKDYAGNDVTIEGKAYSLVRMVEILSTSDVAP